MAYDLWESNRAVSGSCQPSQRGCDEDVMDGDVTNTGERRGECCALLKAQCFPDGAHAIVDSPLDWRRRTRPEVRSEFCRLSRQHLDAAGLSRVSRMADAYDVDAFLQLLSGATCHIGRQRRDYRVLCREHFDRRIGDASARACVLDNRHEFAAVYRPDEFDQRERSTDDRDDAGQRTDDWLNA